MFWTLTRKPHGWDWGLEAFSWAPAPLPALKRATSCSGLEWGLLEEHSVCGQREMGIGTPAAVDSVFREGLISNLRDTIETSLERKGKGV